MQEHQRASSRDAARRPSKYPRGSMDFPHAFETMPDPVRLNITYVFRGDVS